MVSKSARLSNDTTLLIAFLQGYWSSGQRLSDSAEIGGQGIDSGELPEYMVRNYSAVDLYYGSDRRVRHSAEVLIRALGPQTYEDQGGARTEKVPRIILDARP